MTRPSLSNQSTHLFAHLLRLPALGTTQIVWKARWFDATRTSKYSVTPRVRIKLSNNACQSIHERLPKCQLSYIFVTHLRLVTPQRNGYPWNTVRFKIQESHQALQSCMLQCPSHRSSSQSQCRSGWCAAICLEVASTLHMKVNHLVLHSESDWLACTYTHIII